jgi:serine/threonine protein kinase
MSSISSPKDEQGFVKVRGQMLHYLQRKRIRRREYFLLERLGSPRRERFKAFDPLAGPGGDFFQVQFWPAGPIASQNLKLLRRLKDDSFPRVVEWEAGQLGYSVALTWVEGISLAKYLENVRTARRPPVDPGEAVRLIRGLANAICKLHAHLRICHGDIQPANVIITQHPSRLALIDFGSAWIADRATSRLPGDGAHPCYSAPEVFRSNTPSAFHADQFSVSVLFYELLTQQMPYQGLGGKAGRPEYVAGAADNLIPPSIISSACRKLPYSLTRNLDRVVLRGLALDPENRFPNRHAWLDELFRLHAASRFPPQPTLVERWLTQVIAYFAKPSH